MNKKPYPKTLYQRKDAKGHPFRPSNGTEGMMFADGFCSSCIHYDDGMCNLIAMSQLCEIEDEDYPKEWIFSEEGWPICTEWDDGEIYDPNQLSLL